MADHQNEDEAKPLLSLAVTVKQAAAALSVSERTIRRLLAADELAEVRIRGARRVQYASLEELCQAPEKTVLDTRRSTRLDAARQLDTQLKQRFKQRRIT